MHIKTRDPYWDVIKGLGIIAVVLGHAGIKGYFVSLYHLQLFFFVAGYFFNDQYTKDLFVFYGRKLRSLWWPTFQYTTFFVLFHNIFIQMHFMEGVAHGNYLPGESIDKYEILRKIILSFWGQHIEPIGGALWFVFPLLIGLLLFSIVRNVKMRLPEKLQPYIEILFIFTLYFIGIIIIKKRIEVPYWIDISLLVLPIIYAGFVVRPFIHRIIPRNIFFLLLGVFLLIKLLNYCINHEMIVILSDKRYHHEVLFLVITFLGIYMNLLLGTLICKVAVLRTMFAYIGKNSFHIMALHFVCFKAVNFIYILTYDLSYSLMPQVAITTDWWFIYLLAGVGLPLIFVFTYNYSKNIFCKLQAEHIDKVES